MRVGLALALGFFSSCGTSLPARYVLEKDLGEASYRRYQKLDHAEFALPDNPAQSHTAVYLDQDENGKIRYIKTWVSVFKKSHDLISQIRRQLAHLENYSLNVTEEGGDAVWLLQDQNREQWLVWTSGRYVIKVGGAPSEAREEVAEAYLDLYPSDITR